MKEDRASPAEAKLIKELNEQLIKVPVPNKITAKVIAKLAEDYSKAYWRWNKVYDGSEKVRGLDEWHPKHTAWERKEYIAEQQKLLAKEILLRASIKWKSPSLGKRKRST